MCQCGVIQWYQFTDRSKIQKQYKPKLKSEINDKSLKVLLTSILYRWAPKATWLSFSATLNFVITEDSFGNWASEWLFLWFYQIEQELDFYTLHGLSKSADS